MTIFSPSFAIFSFSTSWTVLSSSLSHFWFIKARSPNCFFRRPSTIFALMLSGLPAKSSFPISTSLSLAIMSAGTSSAETNATSGFAAICIATSCANSLKIALMATKSVSLFTSTITPSFELKCTYDAIPPSTERFPAFLSAFAMPFFLSHSMALSMSPAHAFNAFLESRMPAPERWRRSFTCAALITGPSSSGAGLVCSFGASSFGFSSTGTGVSVFAASLYLASSFSTPAAKSASFFSKPSPKSRRTKRRMTIFSPNLAMRSFRTS
mmetsp:Transcript_124279/g.247717  ORF Transcript_124279/g.247717 Transcript_124279/m.247717 type:complete len:268 (-) Transcript_124279:1273-2076(-)